MCPTTLDWVCTAAAAAAAAAAAVKRASGVHDTVLGVPGAAVK